MSEVCRSLHATSTAATRKLSCAIINFSVVSESPFSQQNARIKSIPFKASATVYLNASVMSLSKQWDWERVITSLGDDMCVVLVPFVLQYLIITVIFITFFYLAAFASEEIHTTTEWWHYCLDNQHYWHTKCSQKSLHEKFVKTQMTITIEVLRQVLWCIHSKHKI